ncbi:thermonuclease family protein [Alteraurantiacibacter buctensis]|uniref:Thermonuclease family protein n=1 Tax=Alteraurantiacibacter buctensis TaxID=1503981 RepID=A0A844YTU1_9SPHN|nr:thermonuclease family protein [Alteraurantiacibacter buctensis]MXO70278.1 thermonuclease family protein [Alteraurantiacibacter buctensis]
MLSGNERFTKLRETLIMRIAFLALALIAAPSSVAAETIVGTGSAVDGDSLAVDGAQVRLHGIDAPELDQPCRLNGETWACGQESKAQLEALLAVGPVTCMGVERDTYGRLLATCRVGQFDLNRTMVSEGWATAYRSFSNAYVADETRARAERHGIWRSEFDLPQNYRMAGNETPAPPSRPTASRTRRPAETAFAGGCVIKGNRNRRGEWIYHLPGMPYYNQTRAEEMFCSEADAQAAGYRRAIVR